MSRTLTPERGKLKSDAVRLRRELGWSNRQIVAHLSLPETTIRRWVGHNSEPTVRHNLDSLALNTVHTTDCLEGMKRLPHEYVDLVFADPPYNIGVDYGNGSSSLDRHDAYYDWCSEWFRAVELVLRQGGIFYLMHYPEHVAYLLQAIPKLVINDDFVALNDYWP